MNVVCVDFIIDCVSMNIMFSIYSVVCCVVCVCDFSVVVLVCLCVIDIVMLVMLNIIVYGNSDYSISWNICLYLIRLFCSRWLNFSV